jgi:hypothetical protein
LFGSFVPDAHLSAGGYAARVAGRLAPGRVEDWAR